MKKNILFVTTAFALAACGCSNSNDEKTRANTTSGNDPHAHHTMPAKPSTDTAQTPSTAAFQAVNDKMHKNMALTFTGNPDKDFLTGMIPHHQGAIDMAEVVLQHGKDPKVRKLAQDIIAAQKKEITDMQTWLKNLPANAAQNPSTAAFQAVNDKMHKDMVITFTGSPDKDFLAGMIPHHQGAIDMAEVVLQYGKDPKVRKLAEDIITAQKKEIAEMQLWLKEMK